MSVKVVSKRNQEQAEQFRTYFMRAIESHADKPVLLSGGVDSATHIAAILALGKKPPKCYTFTVGNYVSDDVKVARSMCQTFSIPHEIISIPQNEEQLLTDIKRVLSITSNPSKTHVQCSQPFLYLAPAIRRDGFTSASVGLGAGPLWGNGKNAEMGRRREGEAWFTEFRRKHVHSPTSSSHSIEKVAGVYGVSLYEPWHQPYMENFLLSLTYDEMHTPRQKGLAVRAFAEFWKRGSWYRINSNFQINSRLRDWHDTLLRSSINTSGRKSVVGIYNDMFKEFSS